MWRVGTFSFIGCRRGPGLAARITRVQVKNVPSSNFGHHKRSNRTACQVKARNDSLPHTQNFFTGCILIPKFSISSTF